MQQTIPCSKCAGAGKIPLPEELAKTLSAMRGPTTTEKLCKRIPDVSRMGHANRLAKLFALGLVERTRKGKILIYTTV